MKILNFYLEVISKRYNDLKVEANKDYYFTTARNILKLVKTSFFCNK